MCCKIHTTACNMTAKQCRLNKLNINITYGPIETLAINLIYDFANSRDDISIYSFKIFVVGKKRGESDIYFY